MNYNFDKSTAEKDTYCKMLLSSNTVVKNRNVMCNTHVLSGEGRNGNLLFRLPPKK